MKTMKFPLLQFLREIKESEKSGLKCVLPTDACRENKIVPITVLESAIQNSF